MRHDARKKLLAAYAVALVAERESWERLNDPDLTEAERCRILGEWKQIAAGLRTLARQLREAPAVSIEIAVQPTERPRAAPLPWAAAADEWEVEATAPTGQASAPVGTARGLRRSIHLHCLATSVRLATALRARLETAVLRPGSP